MVEVEHTHTHTHTFFFIVKIFSYQLNVDTNVHIYIFCNKHFRCLQLHFIYKAYPYTYYVLLFHLLFSSSSSSFLLSPIEISLIQLVSSLLFTMTAILLLYRYIITEYYFIVYRNSSRSLHPQLSILSSIKFYFLHYIVARHTLCTVLNRSYRAMCLLFVFQPIYNVWVLITTCLPRVLCDATTKNTESMKKIHETIFLSIPLRPPLRLRHFSHTVKRFFLLFVSFFSFLSIFRSTETINLFDFTVTFVFHSKDTLLVC